MLPSKKPTQIPRISDFAVFFQEKQMPPGFEKPVKPEAPTLQTPDDMADVLEYAEHSEVKQRMKAMREGNAAMKRKYERDMQTYEKQRKRY